MGILTLRFEAHAPQWHAVDDLIAMAKPLASLGITELSVHPASPERMPVPTTMTGSAFAPRGQ